ncbi:UNVERIFIED_CONTAM: Receptor-like kinase TMK4 [Sesamum radiatum]|uniref:Receptor-like kinase TMK4 n=1 Tax=Sesamum radiatum TaxID=300843 RepID=A0AAW2TGT9_SESRA
MSTATLPQTTSLPSTSTPPPSPVPSHRNSTSFPSSNPLPPKKNSLSGTLPSFENMTSLEQIYLDNNGFTSVPNNFLLGLTNLQTFSISENIKLSPWQIPSYLTDSTNLVTFYASNASIVGYIPDIFGSFPNLQNLRLSYNDLNGSLPGSFSGSEIQNLWLNNQKRGLSGGIDVLANMAQLYQFPSGVQVTIGTTNSFCLDKPGPCDPQVTTLLEVAGALGYPMSLAESWQGNNACQDWRFINCDSQGRNVTVVNMGKQGFSGSISPALANLTSLRTLVLNDNNLTGVIPSVLTTLPQLQTFNVSNNNLSGPIPVFPPSVKFAYAGNLLLGKNISGGGGGGAGAPGGNPGSPDGSTSGSSKKSSSAGIIAGVIVAVVIFVGVLLFVSYKCYVKRRHKRFGRVEGSEQGKELVKPNVTNGLNGYAGVPSELQSQSSGDHSEIPVFEGGNVTISIQVLRQVTDKFQRR